MGTCTSVPHLEGCKGIADECRDATPSFALLDVQGPVIVTYVYQLVDGEVSPSLIAPTGFSLLCPCPFQTVLIGGQPHLPAPERCLPFFSFTMPSDGEPMLLVTRGALRPDQGTCDRSFTAPLPLSSLFSFILPQHQETTLTPSGQSRQGRISKTGST